MHDPRPRRAGSVLVRQGPALLCAISRLVGPGRASQWSWGRPLHWREARRTSAKWDEALQYNGGGGAASSAQHRSCFLPARLPKPRCKLRTANSQLFSPRVASQSGERICCHGFHYLSSVQRLESQWGKSNGLDPFTPFNMYLEGLALRCESMFCSFAILSSRHGPDSEKQSGAEKHVLDGVWLFFLS